MHNIKAISSIDGRYKKLTSELEVFFSEFALIKYRLFVEISWFKFLSKELGFFSIKKEDLSKIDLIFENFDEKEALKIKNIESVTNHDVKAVEYYIKEKLEDLCLFKEKEWIHFACTSEDINNCSYALMIKETKKIIIKFIYELLSKIEDIALKYKTVPMMSRTHGQPASPTTVGKEFINFAWRIKRELKILENIRLEAKINGAVGNFNAHYFAFPNVNWIDKSKDFIKKYLKLEPLLFTTQINPYNCLSEILHSFIRISATIMDLDKDMWLYISFNYFKQKIKEGEVGSSTMPHKVNPIDFENSEGNLGVAISLMEHLSVKLLNSRMQRDLSDSTTLRNLGTIFALFLISVKNTLKGLSKLEINKIAIGKDLKENLELLAEPIQTVMRMFGEEAPYEKLKEITRGKKLQKEDIKIFVKGLEKLPLEFQENINKLEPECYIGMAEELVDLYFKKNDE